MAAPSNEIWPDWTAVLSLDYIEATTQSLIELARYANPAMVEGLGLGWEGGSFGEADREVEKALRLAEELDRRRASWTLEPFTPSVASKHLIRTTAELLEGAGTCLDFAVTLAARCVRENVPCSLAVAVVDTSPVGHAFVVVQDEVRDPSEPVTHADTFASWIDLVTGQAGSATDFIDPTPRLEEGPASRISVPERSRLLVDWLQRSSGVLFVVDVQRALQAAGVDPYGLPEGRRELGLVGRLPDLPPDLRQFETHAAVRAWLERADGIVVLQGMSGSGKSTLALERAGDADSGRGWFLDGSDERALRTSLAHAEARSSGSRTGNPQTDYLQTMASAAERRLRSMNRPWVVVIDNAEGDPTELIQLLPVPKKGQLVIVTTTRKDWAAVVGEERVVEVESLQGNDLDDLGGAPGLPKEGWLPGLLRVVRRSGIDPGRLSALEGSPAERVVQAALGIRAGSWPDEPRLRAFAAAAFMPAERITVGWLADAVFEGSREAASQAVAELRAAGLLEPSRQSFDVRDRDEEPIWMHRLIRSVAHRLLPSNWGELAWSVLANFASRSRSTHYTDEELMELADFLEACVSTTRSPVYAEAAKTVLELLEPRSSLGVRRAAQLARTATTTVEPADGRRDGRVKAIMLIAQARLINQTPDPPSSIEEITNAIEWCREAEWLTRFETREDKLLAGRAAAMRGLLIKRKAALIGRGEAQRMERINLLQEALDVLTKSYESRQQALKLEAVSRGGPLDDPDQLLDRGLYNLGSINITLANELRHTAPDTVPTRLTAAMEAYTGSLQLRRATDLPVNNTYAAASLWGIALTAYSAALHCPGRLELDSVVPIEELEPVIREQSRETLLRAAEVAGGKALDMRIAIGGVTSTDAMKARDLLARISTAWSNHPTGKENHHESPALTDDTPDIVIALEKVVDDFEILIGDVSALEKRDIHPFLHKHHFLLAQDAEVVRSEVAFGIGTEMRIDFVLQREDGSYVLVEIERPHHRIFKKNGEPTGEVNHAIWQVEKCRDWIELNLPMLGTKFPGMLSPDGLVVIGRSYDLSDEELKSLQDLKARWRRRQIRISTYDDLVKEARSYLRRLQRPLGEDLGPGQQPGFAA